MERSASVNTKNVKEKLLQLYSKDRRNIVFWYDDNGDFENFFFKEEFPGVEKWLLDNNEFETKHALEVEKPDANFLIYAPRPKPDNKDNWLYDIMLYSQEFSADKATLILSELGIQNPSLKAVIKEHLTFFDSKRRHEAIKKMNLYGATEEKLNISFVSVLAGVKTPDIDTALKEILKCGFEEETNSKWKDIQKIFSPQKFWGLIEKQYGYSHKPQSLKHLFTCLSFTHLCSTFTGDFPEKFKRYLLSLENLTNLLEKLTKSTT